MSFDWKKLVGTVAPTIATALGGPLAGMATKAISNALGIEGDVDELSIEQNLVSASPDVLLKLKDAEYQFKLDLKKADIDIHRIDAQDRHSARDLAKSDTWKTTAILSYLMFALVIACLYVAVEMPPSNEAAKDILFMVIGNITGGLSMVLTFYFGSSVGSRSKDVK